MNLNAKISSLMNNARPEKKLVPDRGRNWGYHETMDLLTLWSDSNVQAELDASVRNQHVYEKISTAMVEKGHPRTAEQCRDKVKKLKKDYNDVISNKTTLSRSMCKYFEIMDKVIRTKNLPVVPMIEAEVLLDTSIKPDPDDTTVPIIVDSYSECTNIRDNDGRNPSDLSQTPSEISDNDADSITLNGNNDDQFNQTHSSWTSSTQLPNNDGPANTDNLRVGPIRRRRKVNKSERMLATIVDRFVDSIHDAEQRFISLEEKRLKMAMEMEERRLEREERRRREERQHEIKLLQIITQAITSVTNTSTVLTDQNSDLENGIT